MSEWLAGLIPGGAVTGLFTDTAALSMIVGVVSPWLIAFVQQPQWSTRARKLVAVAASVVLGVLTSLATGSFADGPVSIGGAVAIVLVASQSTYKTLAQPSSGRMRTETATSPKRKRKRATRKARPVPPAADQPDHPVQPPVRPPPAPEPEDDEPVADAPLLDRAVAEGRREHGRHALPE